MPPQSRSPALATATWSSVEVWDAMPKLSLLLQLGPDPQSSQSFLNRPIHRPLLQDSLQAMPIPNRPLHPYHHEVDHALAQNSFVVWPWMSHARISGSASPPDYPRSNVTVCNLSENNSKEEDPRKPQGIPGQTLLHTWQNL